VKPQVTIGICTKNCEKYITETIDSILKQDLPHQLLEIIVVDGYSTDKTLPIIEKKLEKSEIESKFFSDNKGLGAARQIIVDRAKGEYILWVDGDMVLSQGFVRKLVDFMDKNADVGIVKGRQALEAGKNLLATLETFSRAASRMVDYQSKKGRSKTLGTAGALCRTEVIRQVGGFDRNLKGYNEDWDIEIRVRGAGWSLCTIDAFYSDYERLGLTWKDLWKKYWLRGFYTHYFLHKKKGMVKLYRMIPPTAIISGILNAITLFKITHMKTVFLLPFQSMFKMTAWNIGFIRSHMNSYAPP
jgi:glycosyltransferase involved in cell wall biosynthesis